MTSEMLEWARGGQAAQRSVDDILGPKGGNPRERELAEAWDEVERLRGVVERAAAVIERLQIEKHDLAERLMKAGSKPT